MTENVIFFDLGYSADFWPQKEYFSRQRGHLGLKWKLMNLGSFVATFEAVIFTLKCCEIFLFDRYLSSGQHFLSVSADVVGDILQ